MVSGALSSSKTDAERGLGETGGCWEHFSFSVRKSEVVFASYLRYILEAIWDRSRPQHDRHAVEEYRKGHWVRALYGMHQP
jgi:hypothetical protein